jgi:hypothetical protein
MERGRVRTPACLLSRSSLGRFRSRRSPRLHWGIPQSAVPQRSLSLRLPPRVIRISRLRPPGSLREAQDEFPAFLLGQLENSPVQEKGSTTPDRLRDCCPASSSSPPNVANLQPPSKVDWGTPQSPIRTPAGPRTVLPQTTPTALPRPTTCGRTPLSRESGTQASSCSPSGVGGTSAETNTKALDATDPRHGSEGDWGTSQSRVYPSPFPADPGRARRSGRAADFGSGQGRAESSTRCSWLDWRIPQSSGPPPQQIPPFPVL